MSVLFSQLVVLLFVFNVKIFQFLNISIQLFLFLLHSLMMHFVEIPFLQQFIISCFGFLSHDHSLIELALNSLYLLS